MRNKSILINRLIYSLIITIFLINLFIKTPNGKIIMLPFLICSFANLGKTISLIINKKKYIRLCNIIFIISFFIFWFGFLSYWCYSSFITKNYSLLLFSIPFWIIGFYMIKKKIIKTTKKSSSTKTNFNFKIIISSTLVVICLFTGLIMLFFGIKDTYNLNKQTKNYLTTNGYFKDYDIYNNDENGATYKLIYTYKVNGNEYSISTDYGTNYIPSKNSVRGIKYNPENPEDAILIGTNNKNILIFMGMFFTFGSFTFILGALSIFGYFDKFKIDIVGTYIGIIFFIIGIGIILIQNGITISLIETIKSFGLWILIPLMFIIIGIFQIVKCLILKK